MVNLYPRSIEFWSASCNTCLADASLVFRTRRQRDSRMLILKSPLYPGGACVASVARLMILLPDLANLANFWTAPANFIFNFFVYPAMFEPHPASTVLASTFRLFLTLFKPNLAKFGPWSGYLDFLDLATLCVARDRFPNAVSFIYRKRPPTIQSNFHIILHWLFTTLKYMLNFYINNPQRKLPVLPAWVLGND